MNKEDIFKVGNRITTNGVNVLEILGVNELEISCVDLYNSEFDILSKTEHNYLIADNKTILKNSLSEILDDVDIAINEKDLLFIKKYMNLTIDKLL